MKRPAKWLLLGLLLPLAPPARAALEPRVDDRVDLHAHLFFHEGAGLNWFGSFAGPIRAKSWKDRIRSKVNAEALELSGARMVAVALYSHPLFLGSQRNAIRRQIAAAEDFVATHSDWVIARSASEARSSYLAGKRILFFTLEGADGVLETEEDLKEFVDERGIRIVTPLHFVNDQFGGAALMPGIAGLVSPVSWLRSFWSPRDEEGTRLNPEGLTARGEEFIESLVARGVWIDFSHASDASFKQMLPIVERARQPVLYTHTVLRRVYEAERGISKKQLAEVRRTGGIVGLVPSVDMIGNLRVPGLEHPCAKGIPALAQEFLEVSDAIGRSSVSLGTDINAPLDMLPPDCLATEDAAPARATPEADDPAAPPQVDERGFYQYGQLGRIWDALRKRGVGAERNPGLKAARFIELWSSVRPKRAEKGR